MSLRGASEMRRRLIALAIARTVFGLLVLIALAVGVGGIAVYLPTLFLLIGAVAFAAAAIVLAYIVGR
jgi:hypothetical protein